jgi:mono/diheme cytochrome c family protein
VAFWLLLSTLSACDHDAVAEGEAIYERTCENCHGEDGTAGIQVDGVAAADLTVVIPAFSDADLETVITEGSGAMPAQDLEGREVDDVIAYLRATFPDQE